MTRNSILLWNEYLKTMVLHLYFHQKRTFASLNWRSFWEPTALNLRNKEIIRIWWLVNRWLCHRNRTFFFGTQAIVETVILSTEVDISTDEAEQYRIFLTSVRNRLPTTKTSSFFCCTHTQTFLLKSLFCHKKRMTWHVFTRS